MSTANFLPADATFLKDIAAQLPELASELGDTSGDGRLGEADPIRREALLRSWRSWKQALSTGSGEDDPAPLALARRAVADQLSLIELAGESFDRGPQDPELLEPLIDSALRQLLRPGVDAPQRAEALTGLLRSWPSYLEGGRGLVSAPHPTLLARAQASASEVGAWLEILQQQVNLLNLNSSLLKDFEEAWAGASAAWRQQDIWLKDLKASGDEIATDREALEELSRRRHVLSDLRQLQEMGEQMLNEHRIEMRRLARRIDPEVPVGAMVARARHLVPVDAAASAGALHERLRQTRDFLINSGLLHLPQDERLEVVEVRGPVPELQASLRLLPASPVAPLVSTLLLLPGDAAGQIRLGPAELAAAVVQHVYPGRHLQRVHALASGALVLAGVPLRHWVPAASWAADFIDGWPLYCLELMLEAEHITSDVERFVVAEIIERAAVCFLVDLALSQGELPAAQAQERLRRDARLSPAQALAAVAGMIRSPLRTCAAAMGAREIFALRVETKARWGEAFTLQRFHQLLLSAGLVPLHYLDAQLARHAGPDAS